MPRNTKSSLFSLFHYSEQIVDCVLLFSSSNYYWLYLDKSGSWAWQDGTAYTWSNFNPDPPDTTGSKICAMASITDHKWISAKCSNTVNDAVVLCQITGKELV